MSELLLRCGCVVPFRDKELPYCHVHRTATVARVLNMPAPRMRGTATGPHVETTDLPAWSGSLKES